MNVGDSRAFLECLNRLIGDLLRRNRHVGVLSPLRARARRRYRNNDLIEGGQKNHSDLRKRYHINAVKAWRPLPSVFMNERFNRQPLWLTEWRVWIP